MELPMKWIRIGGTNAGKTCNSSEANEFVKHFNRE